MGAKGIEAAAAVLGGGYTGEKWSIPVSRS